MTLRRSVPRLLAFTLVLAAAWYLLSGKLDLLHFGTGVVSALVIALIARAPADRSPYRVGALLGFLPWLAGQVLLSNLRIARIVLSPGLAIRPTLLRLRPTVRGERALTLLGMGTTLTPGTLTVDVTGDLMLVHALDEVSAADVRAGTMAARVARVVGPEAG